MRKSLVGLLMTGVLAAGAATVATAAPNPVDALDTPIGFGADTTGGVGGGTVTVSSTGEFVDAVAAEGPLTVQVEGTIGLSGMVPVGSDKTIVGVGTTGGLAGGGLNIRQANNVIVQRLTISGSGDDNINVEESTNIWIDHTDLSNAADGALDIKAASDAVTVSWNHFHDQDKNTLLGHSDDNEDQDKGKLRVTYHHNWFDGTSQRNPRVRFGNPVHVFNNYYNDINSYGVASTMNAGVLVERNHFENVEDPFHLGEGDSGPGSLVASNNQLVNSGNGETGGSVAEIPYAYAPDNAANVKSIVTGGAGVQ
ncbi:pectate lyase [Saccharopolyspora aridisoli]|uniref:Pectate lyase n=1 Tax=Saccharopolyspora aridisoli TaxID=2530385 RepID=A0A4R4UI17_9PSEU|nr:pectate lyase [Saccharopolyspora aridisoli]TDC91507.1 pectate lyase [Saccharopolyspora aridisoli]